VALLAPILALVGIVWYIVAAWRNDYRLVAFAALLIVGIGVAIAMGKLDGDLLRYASIAAGVCSLLLLVGAVIHWRQLLLPWLLLVGANVLAFASGEGAPWLKDVRKLERPHGPREPRHAPR